jgi:hypothetical protein
LHRIGRSFGASAADGLTAVGDLSTKDRFALESIQDRGQLRCPAFSKSSKVKIPPEIVSY